MPYPDEAEGFQIDSPETYTEFHKRYVRAIQFFLLSGPFPVVKTAWLWRPKGPTDRENLADF